MPSDPNPTRLGREAIHYWFNLTYAAYLTIPRSVLQSMPAGWQERMVALLEELGAACSAAGIELPATKVSVCDPAGRFMHDWLKDYDRGRRDVFRENVNVR